MNYITQNIADILLIEPKIHGDFRGYFAEIFRQDSLEEALSFKVNFVQDNESKSSFGVLRGLHYQIPPYSQSKLIRVTKGKILDVALDIRKKSKTFGQHVAVELSDANMHQLFIPSGFAHGFIVLSEIAQINYKVDNFYSPEHERGIAFNDPKLNIDWGLSLSMIKLSNKDKMLPLLNDASDLFD